MKNKILSGALLFVFSAITIQSKAQLEVKTSGDVEAGGNLIVTDSVISENLRVSDNLIADHSKVARSNHSPQAISWYGVHYYRGYPQESQAPLITDIQFSIDGDTIINGSPYKKILYTHLFDGIVDAYRGAIRNSTDKQQVYFVPWGSQVEYLLYDFSVNQGDIVRAYNGFYDISCEEMAQDDPEFSITPAWTVLDIKTMDGRKHISVQNKANGNIMEWIEGIGTQHIFWPVGRSCLPTGMEYQTVRTLCVEDGDGNILYSFNTDDLGIRNECHEWKPLPIEHIHAKTPSATKLFHNAQFFILRGERTYTLTGQEVK